MQCIRGFTHNLWFAYHCYFLTPMLTLLLLLIDSSNRMMVLHYPKQSYEYQPMHLYMEYFVSCNTFMSPMYRWEQLHTTGTPPLGGCGYASCHFGGDIFYFAGYCGHERCYHNSLYCLSTETLVWKELFPTSKTSGPMRKVGTALLPFDGQLLAVAGRGSETPTNPSPMAKYSNW